MIFSERLAPTVDTRYTHSKARQANGYGNYWSAGCGRRYTRMTTDDAGFGGCLTVIHSNRCCPQTWQTGRTLHPPTYPVHWRTPSPLPPDTPITCAWNQTVDAEGCNVASIPVGRHAQPETHTFPSLCKRYLQTTTHSFICIQSQLCRCKLFNQYLRVLRCVNTCINFFL